MYITNLCFLCFMIFKKCCIVLCNYKIKCKIKYASNQLYTYKTFYTHIQVILGLTCVFFRKKVT